MYLKERGDANIKTIDDLINKGKFFTDVRPGTDFTSYKEQLQRTNSAEMLDLAVMFQNRRAYQTIVLQCMAMQNLDALVYPTGIAVTKSPRGAFRACKEQQYYPDLGRPGVKWVSYDQCPGRVHDCSV